RVVLELREGGADVLGQPVVDEAQELPHLHERALHVPEGGGDILGAAQLEGGVELLAPGGGRGHPAEAVRRSPGRRAPAQPADREQPLGAPGLQNVGSTMNSMARRMFELVEPIGVIPYSADEPNEAMFALGFTNYWDTYFAGRAAPLGLAPAEVVDALFYNFAPGEVARHIPKVWRTTTPEAAIAARHMGRVTALLRMRGRHLDRRAFAG